jgi:hypothetical protein
VAIDPTIFGATGFAFPVATSPTDYPVVGNVRSGVAYNFGSLTGSMTEPSPADVRAGVSYGAGGTEFNGTLVVPVPPTPGPVGSPAGDWQVWDNRETVSFTVVARSGNTTYPAVANCKRRQLGKRELAASNGAYVAGDRNWLIPVAMLPANVTPAIGDQVIDGQSVVWSVLEAQLNTWQTWWRLTARNLVLSANLRELVTLLQPSTTQDSAGGRVPSFSAAASNLPAKILEIEAEAEDRLGKRQAVRRFTAWVGQRVFPSANWRLKDSTGTVYTITGWRSADRFDVLQELDLEVVK